MRTLHVRLPAPPSVNSVWKQVRNRKTGVRGVAKSETYVAWLRECQQIIKYEIGWKGPPMMAYSIQVGAARNRRRDLDNFWKGINDLLKKSSVIVDDRYAEEMRIYWDDGLPPRTVYLRVVPL